MENHDTHKIDFENIQQRLDDVFVSGDYLKLIRKITQATKIFVLGNGGLHFVAQHGTTDMSRLIPGKAFYTFDSVGFITSNANDHGYDSLFVKWLETMVLDVERPSETLIIGTSCSGNSANIINALEWGEKHWFSTFLISGQKSSKLPENIDELSFNCEYFHTAEIMTLMVFYDIIYKTGNRCPTIAGEKKRKGFE